MVKKRKKKSKKILGTVPGVFNALAVACLLIISDNASLKTDGVAYAAEFGIIIELEETAESGIDAETEETAESRIDAETEETAEGGIDAETEETAESGIDAETEKAAESRIDAETEETAENRIDAETEKAAGLAENVEIIETVTLEEIGEDVERCTENMYLEELITDPDMGEEDFGEISEQFTEQVCERSFMQCDLWEPYAADKEHTQAPAMENVVVELPHTGGRGAGFFRYLRMISTTGMLGMVLLAHRMQQRQRCKIRL